MNDQLKKYIDDNRDEFDHLEASPTIFTQIMGELKSKPKAKTTFLSLLNNHKWMAAAAILLTISITYMVFNKATTRQPIHQQQAPSTHQQQLANTKPANAFKEKVAQHQNKSSIRAKVSKTYQPIDMPSVYRKLTDSSSASTRLSAILQIQKSGVMDNDIIDRLAKTLSNDPNSNVRLAALDLLANYASYGYVTNVFIQSLSAQKDPLVQLDLINLLAKTNNTKLDEKLYALANDPSTYAEIKDQAYLILLNQNKL